MNRPSQITVGPAEYLDWCERAKNGEVTILSVICISNARYRLNLLWPDVPVQKDLFTP